MTRETELLELLSALVALAGRTAAMLEAESPALAEVGYWTTREKSAFERAKATVEASRRRLVPYTGRFLPPGPRDQTRPRPSDLLGRVRDFREERGRLYDSALQALLAAVEHRLADTTPPALLAAAKNALLLWEKHGLGDADRASEPVYLELKAAIHQTEGGA